MTYYDETQASLFVDVEGSPVGLEGSTWTLLGYSIDCGRVPLTRSTDPNVSKKQTEAPTKRAHFRDSDVDCIKQTGVA